MLAWLHTPADEKDKRTRATRFGSRVVLPELDCLHIVEWLFECGAESWAEIRAWIDVSGRSVSHWEATMMHRLRSIYSSKSREFNGVQVNAPKIEA